MKRGLIFALVGLLVIAVIVVIVSALSNSSKNKTPIDNTLTIWSPFDEEKVYQEISAEFLAENPDVKLSFKYIEANDSKEYEAKVVDAIAAGTGPDIWLIRNDWLPKHESKLTSSKSYVSWSKDSKQTELEAASSYFGSAITGQNSRNGELFTTPLSVDSLALYINTKVVSETSRDYDDAGNSTAVDQLSALPVTWDGVQQWSRLLTKKDNRGAITKSGIALGTSVNSYAPVDTLITLLTQYSGSLFTEDEKSVAIHLIKVVDGANKTPGAQALDLLTSFAKPTHENYTWNAGLGDPIKAFVDGRLAMFIGYSSAQSQIRALNKNFEDVKILPLPQVADPAVSNKRADGAYYWTQGVSKFSNKPSLAWTYLKALTSQVKKYSKLTGKPVPDSGEVVTIKLSPTTLGDMGLYSQQVIFATTPFKKDWQGVDEIVQDMLNQALLPNQSTQSVVDSAAARLKDQVK